jgi:catalase-peroxidase
MNRTKLFSTTRIAGVISLLFMSGAVLAETAEMSKPKGAVGTGVTKAYEAKTNQFWWPDQLNLSALRDHDSRSNPYGADFNYGEAFSKLNLAAVKKDIDTLLTTSQDW